MDGSTSIRILGGRKTDEILPDFSRYWRGINALLERTSDDAVLLQDPSRRKIVISKTGRDTLLVFGMSDDCDLSLENLGLNDAIAVIRSSLHDRILEATAIVRATVKVGVDQSSVYKMLDRIDNYIEAIRILNSR